MPGINVWLEAQFIKTHLNALVEWNGIGTKRDNLSILDYLKVEILAREVVMIVLLLVGILQTINPNRSLEKASCQFLMTAIRKTALYMFGL